MRVAIIGSKSLSVNILHTLLENKHDVVAVYTRDDEPGMRIWHQELGHPSLKAEAEKIGLNVYEGMRVNSGKSLSLLQSLNLDIIFSCFWSEIFREAILNIPKLGVFNIHTAFLPKNRGSRPIPWALINEEKVTGVTLHKMMTGVDNGPIVERKSVEIEKGDTAETLYGKVIDAGSEVFKNALRSFDSNTYQLTQQPLAEVSYQPRGEPFGGQINPYWTSNKINRFKQAFTFPPFRGWRSYPNVGAKTLVFVTQKNLNATLLPNAVLLKSKSAETSIGNPTERRILKEGLKSISTSSTLIHCKVDADNFPLLDVIVQLGYRAVSFKSVRDYESTNSAEHQPHRYKNGLLEFPHLSIKSAKDSKETIKMLIEQSAQSNQTKFLHLHLNANFTEIDLLRQELKKLGAEEISFEQVCDLFNTKYENISS